MAKITDPHSVVETVGWMFNLITEYRIVSVFVDKDREVTHIKFFSAADPRPIEAILEQCVKEEDSSLGAVGMVLVTCHPNGDETTTKNEIDFTAQLYSRTAGVGISLIDHVVITDKRFFSYTDSQSYSR